MDASGNNRISPDYSAFDELWEHEHPGILASLATLARHSASKAGILSAIIALSYIAKKIVEAGNELTLSALLGALVIAAMIVAVAVTVFLVELRSNAQINKKSFDKSIEPTDERQCSEKTGETPRRDRRRQLSRSRP